MGRKLNTYDRKKLLEAREQGFTNAELKEKFTLKDDRTLKRQIKLAEQEYEARLVKTEILKDALASHHAEIRELIGRWKQNIGTPWFGTIYNDMPYPMIDIEADPLFGSLREHLPFPILWRNYSIWTKKEKEYVDGCKKLIEEVGEEAKSSHNEDTLREWGTDTIVKALALVEPLRGMMAEYRKRAKSEMKPLLDEIEPLQDKLHTALKEILLRRDYIMYTCRLCPGQPRLVR